MLARKVTLWLTLHWRSGAQAVEFILRYCTGAKAQFFYCKSL